MMIGVIGSGIMGHGIAQVFAMSDHRVILVDLQAELLAKAKKNMENSIGKIISKNNMDTSVEAIMSRVSFTTDYKELKECDLVIEAIIEKIEEKKKLFKTLDKICSEKTIFASNTSSLSITEMADATNRPDRVCGMHFFNPPAIMKLVEIVKGKETSEETIKKASAIVEEINKRGVIVEDSPLFVVNRILVPMICEAIFVLQEGIASPEDIDEAMQLGANHPIGPLKLADMIGLDTLLRVQESLLETTGDDKYRIPELLKKMVNEGNLGKKSGKGFYDYKVTVP